MSMTPKRNKFDITNQPIPKKLKHKPWGRNNFRKFITKLLKFGPNSNPKNIHRPMLASDWQFMPSSFLIDVFFFPLDRYTLAIKTTQDRLAAPYVECDETKMDELINFINTMIRIMGVMIDFAITSLKCHR